MSAAAETRVCDLSGKTALVTGGSRGIGRAIAVRLAQSGARVAINYVRHARAAEETAEQIRAAGGEALILKANLARHDQIGTNGAGRDEHALVRIVGPDSDPVRPIGKDAAQLPRAVTVDDGNVRTAQRTAMVVWIVDWIVGDPALVPIDQDLAVDGRAHQAFVDEQIRFNQWFRENGGRIEPTIELLDTTTISIRRAAEQVAAWTRCKLADERTA